LAGSVAVRARVPKEKALPFERLDPNAKTVRAMKDARRGKLRRFDRVEDVMADLHAKD
jgi:DNA-damage-inducible protein J